jgi:NAD(P)-dependent dehydrogenase (short-subunit alcohol dehydrogenase family)
MAPGPSISTILSHFLPPKAQFTEKNLPDLTGKVYIVTGANTGLGKEIARMLFAKNARVYVAARSENKTQKAIDDIKTSNVESRGELRFLFLDLNDMDKIKAAVQVFLGQEQKLNVLYNNAGVMGSPQEPPMRTVQGYEQCLGVNGIGTFLFTQLLTPMLAATARAEPPDSVRVVWVSSFGIEVSAQDSVGVSTENLDYHVPLPTVERYGISKCASWALAVEYARRHRADGIVSVPLNPGNLRTELLRDQSMIFRRLVWLMSYPVVNGAYTQLYAGFSPDVTAGGVDWSRNWGKWEPVC